MVSKSRFVALSDFRHNLTRFLRFSEAATRAAGLTQTQYLLLLHLRGQPYRNWSTVGELALRLQASPHGTVSLIKRCVRLGLLTKQRAESDARRVEIHLTACGERQVQRIAARHLEQLRSLKSMFQVRRVK